MILKVKDKMSDKMVYSNSLFNISALDHFGKLTIRAEINNSKFQKIIKDFFKLKVPSRLKISTNKNFYLAWMSPNEIMVITKNQDEIKTIKSSIEKYNEFNYMFVEEQIFNVEEGFPRIIPEYYLTPQLVFEITEPLNMIK